MLIRLLMTGLLAVAAAHSLVSYAQDAPPPAATEQAGDQETAGPPDEVDAASDEPPAATDSVGGQMGEVSLEKFIPSEEITADGAVSFPVDI